MARAAVEQLVRQVEAGESELLEEYLKAMAKFRQYSVGNAILIGFQKPDATHVAGFRTWQQLGRHVKKGERGIAIMAPIVYRSKTGPEEDGEEQAEDETVRAFKTVHVFDISQTDGKPLPEFARVDGDPGVYAERLKGYVSGRGIEVEYNKAMGSADGMSSGGLIRLKKGLSAAEEFSVLVHELAHEMLHKDRDNMPKDKKVRETEAEAVAFVVCCGVGLDVSSASSDYIQLYNGEKKTLLESLERIQRTAAQILEAITRKSQSRFQIGNTSMCAATVA